MKKISGFLIALALCAGCGPNEEEKAKKEQEAGQAVDSLMDQLESEIGTGSENTSEKNVQEEQTQTKESEEAPK